MADKINTIPAELDRLNNKLLATGKDVFYSLSLNKDNCYFAIHFNNKIIPSETMSFHECYSQLRQLNYLLDSLSVGQPPSKNIGEKL